LVPVVLVPVVLVPVVLVPVVLVIERTPSVGHGADHACGPV